MDGGGSVTGRSNCPQWGTFWPCRGYNTQFQTNTNTQILKHKHSNIKNTWKQKDQGSKVKSETFCLKSVVMFQIWKVSPKIATSPLLVKRWQFFWLAKNGKQFAMVLYKGGNQYSPKAHFQVVDYNQGRTRQGEYYPPSTRLALSSIQCYLVKLLTFALWPAFWGPFLPPVVLVRHCHCGWVSTIMWHYNCVRSIWLDSWTLC